MWWDRGKDFQIDNNFGVSLKNEHEIDSPHLGLKAVFVELINRILIDLIKEPMYFGINLVG